MTCIIGLVDGGNVFMGGDSAGMSGWTQTRVVERKVQRVGDMLIGCSGIPRLGQIAAQLILRERNDDETPFQYMVNSFIPCLQTVVKETAFDWHTENSESSALLIGYAGQLFLVCNDYSVNTCADGFAAMGQRDMALGAMAALAGANPEGRILMALDIVGQFSGAVCGPYYVEVL